jgi:hypothetical protein
VIDPLTSCAAPYLPSDKKSEGFLFSQQYDFPKLRVGGRGLVLEAPVKRAGKDAMAGLRSLSPGHPAVLPEVHDEAPL